MDKSDSNLVDKVSDSKETVTFFKVLISSFTTIFIAELGDKTQIATLMLSAQSGQPLLIFIGAALALICTSLLGVLIGRWIANNLPRQRFTFGAGILMLCLGLFLLIQGIIEFLEYQKIN